LRFGARHVDGDRALALAALARETQVERVLHVLVAPTARQRIAFEHLEEQTGSSPRRMRLFARDPVTRAHRAAAVTAALADADAADRREREAVTIGRIRKMCVEL